ncbi:formaldehyde-activating enzyme [Pseudonocardia parietis]|uniref:Formaldehyde-activating enzyme n=1 Tax=Pseudonocardia parietis TaxID=570936 RepID=A0ABS4W720_9PSEU|nr:formaldehyde-activating enzyme [Pseudonocardia parietis]
MSADTPAVEAMVFGPCQVGIARGVLDAVADRLLEADQDTLVLVSLWLEAGARAEDAVCGAARTATLSAVREAVHGRSTSDVGRLVRDRDRIGHPFYGAG